MEKSLEELADVVKTWRDRRTNLAGPFTTDGLRKFAEVHNAMTRRLISVMQVNDPDFYSSLLELSQHAITMLNKGKFVVDHKDRTNA